MTLHDLYRNLHTEEQCLAYLETVRWPNGIKCLRCRAPQHFVERYERKGTTGKVRKLFECKLCGYQFSHTTGTLFHDTHLPLMKWFMAISLICQAKKGISANQVGRTIGVTYKTAWFLCHRIREAMMEACPVPLSGVIEFDETFLSGKPRKGAIKRTWAERLITDDATCYQFGFSPEQKAKHEKIVKRLEGHSKGDVHVNTVESAFGLLKRGLIGNFHRMSYKHLHRYLSEFEYRFNHRKEPHAMFMHVVEKLARADNMPYQKLTQANGEIPEAIITSGEQIPLSVAGKQQQTIAGDEQPF